MESGQGWRIAKLSQQNVCHWWQNIHYHLANLKNHIITNILFFFLVQKCKKKPYHIQYTTTNNTNMKPLKPWRYSTITHGPNFDAVKKMKKNCSPIQSWSGKNWLQSWSTFISELLPSLLVGGAIGNEAVVRVISPFITHVWLFDVTSANSG